MASALSASTKSAISTMEELVGFDLGQNRSCPRIIKINLPPFSGDYKINKLLIYHLANIIAISIDLYVLLKTSLALISSNYCIHYSEIKYCKGGRHFNNNSSYNVPSFLFLFLVF